MIKIEYNTIFISSFIIIPPCKKRVIVLKLMRCDRLGFPAAVIQSLLQAEPFPCSVSSLGRTVLFKALDTSTYVKMSMATRNLTWASGKRKASASPHTQHQLHTTLKSVYRIYPDNIIHLDLTL